jgi:hypothetical protein
MSGSIRLVFRNIGVTTAILLSAALANHAPAAPAPGNAAAATLVEYIRQQGEIQVRGKVLSERIAAAEDDFFRLHNALNSNDQYDVICEPMALDANTMTMVRECKPRFSAYLPRRNKGFELDIINTGDYGGADPSIAFGGSYARGRPQVPLTFTALMPRSKNYATNLKQVVNGDPRLLERIEVLEGLYDQMTLVQEQYAQIRRDILAARISKGIRTNAGPRVL